MISANFQSGKNCKCERQHILKNYLRTPNILCSPVVWEESLFGICSSSISTLSRQRQDPTNTTHTSSATQVTLQYRIMNSIVEVAGNLHCSVYIHLHTCENISMQLWACCRLCSQDYLPLVKWRLASVFTTIGRGSVSCSHCRPHLRYHTIHSEKVQLCLDQVVLIRKIFDLSVLWVTKYGLDSIVIFYHDIGSYWFNKTAHTDQHQHT